MPCYAVPLYLQPHNLSFVRHAALPHIYKVKGVKEENAKGAWWGLEIDLAGPVQEKEVYAAAKAFHANILSGAVEVAPPPASENATANDGF